MQLHRRSNLVGQIFGKLTVIEKDGLAEVGDMQRWLCKCECGESYHSTTKRLKGGVSKQCRKCSIADSHKSGEDNRNWKGIGRISRSWFSAKINNAKKSSENKGNNREISITFEEVYEVAERQNFRCVYTSEKLTFHKPSTRNEKPTASIDRIDNTKGYTKDNIQLTTSEVNLMRGALTHDRFLELCGIISKEHKK